MTSVRRALLMLGDDAVWRMVSVAVAGALTQDRFTPLLSMAVVAARFCELPAPRIGAKADYLYLLGWLSLLDVLLETPIESILEELPIAPDNKSALAGRPSHGLCPLQLVRFLESCEWVRGEAMVKGGRDERRGSRWHLFGSRAVVFEHDRGDLMLPRTAAASRKARWHLAHYFQTIAHSC